MKRLLSLRPRIFVAAALAALLTGAVATAQTGQAGIEVSASALADSMETPLTAVELRQGALPLTLEQAVEISLQRNLSLLLERYDQRQADFAVFGNQSIYDLLLSATGTTLESTPATVNTTQAGATEVQSVSFNLSQLTAFGGTFDFRWTNGRTDTENAFFAINPSYEADVDFTFTQPLLQNFGRLATQRGVRLARLDRSLSREEFERQVQLTVQSVENAYWGLIDAREQLNVADEALDLAKELHERNKIEVEVGTRAPLELITSEANIATQQEVIIRTQAAVEDAEDQLRRLLNLPADLWDVPLDLLTSPISEALDIDLEAAIATALVERPEMRSQQLTVERFELDADYFRKQKRPRLDLNVNYNLGGFAGQGLIPDPDDPTAPPVVIDTGLFDALEQIRDRDFDGWRVSLTYAVPIQNRAARANSMSASLAAERAEVQLEDLEQQILTEVRTAVRGVSTAAQQIASARVSRQLQEKNLEAEQKRYENGMSTSFQVTQVQEDLTQARSREVSAVTGYRIALAAYHLATGRLLDQFGIEIVGEETEDQTSYHPTGL